MDYFCLLFGFETVATAATISLAWQTHEYNSLGRAHKLGYVSDGKFDNLGLLGGYNRCLFRYREDVAIWPVFWVTSATFTPGLFR
jgi:hypothetical protein